MKTVIIPHHLPLARGLISRLAIQCVCPDTGHKGSFLFTGESPKTKLSRVSPVYDDLTELFPAVRAAGWASVGGGGNCGMGYVKI